MKYLRLYLYILHYFRYTYEVAPAFTLAEHEVIQQVLQLIGFQDGDGIFSPGMLDVDFIHS
jgi:hypothetical protein